MYGTYRFFREFNQACVSLNIISIPAPIAEQKAVVSWRHVVVVVRSVKHNI
jgi:hypothetical protein